MIQFLIKTFIKNHEKTEDRAVRTAYGNLACIVSVVCNLLLAGGKIAVGVLTGSVAVTADGMNNRLEELGGCKIKYISVGPERDACIVRD